jgi:hypothetical protein
MGALAGVNGDIWLSTSPPTALVSNLTFNDSGDHIHYFTSDSTKQAWDPTAGITVQCSPNGTTGWSTVTDYVYYWAVGEIVFNTARSVGTNNFVRVSQGSYFTLSALDGAHAWKASMKGATKDCTPFQAPGGWATYTGTLKSVTWSVDCFAADARILNEMISSGVGQINASGGIILCQLWFNEAGGQRYQFYALPTGETFNIAANDIEKETVNFTATGPVYAVLSNTFNTTNVKQM